MRRVVVTIVAAMLASGGVAHAQPPGGVELIPFAGYRWGGGLSTLSGVRDFDTEDTFSFGVALDKNQRSSAVEIYYAYFAGDIDATLDLGPTISATITRNDIMLNGIWYASGAERATRPYLSAGLGASIFSSDRTETIGRFAWNLGAGVRRDMNEKLGLRLDGRWMPTWVTTGSGIWCDPFYGCYGVGTGESYDQFEVSLGLIIKLGRS